MTSRSTPKESASRRISSLGSVNDDEKGLKHHWLWTTLASNDPVDFDSWRVFIWNLRRHRFETSYRQRELEGYFPVTRRSGGARNRLAVPFTSITKDDDGKFYKRTYHFDGSLVHLAGTEELAGLACRYGNAGQTEWVRYEQHAIEGAPRLAQAAMDRSDEPLCQPLGRSFAALFALPDGNPFRPPPPPVVRLETAWISSRPCQR